MKLFLQKMQNFRALGASPPDPLPPAAGGLPLNPQPPAAGGFAPRPPKQPPLCEFLATRLPPSKQPIINQGEDSDENSDNDSGLASDLSSSYDSRSGTGTPTMISKFANLAKRRAEDFLA